LSYESFLSRVKSATGVRCVPNVRIQQLLAKVHDALACQRFQKVFNARQGTVVIDSVLQFERIIMAGMFDDEDDGGNNREPY
jgi:hypothetical protein